MPEQSPAAVTFSLWLSVASDTEKETAFSFFFLITGRYTWLYSFQLCRNLFIDTL